METNQKKSILSLFMGNNNSLDDILFEIITEFTKLINKKLIRETLKIKGIEDQELFSVIVSHDQTQFCNYINKDNKIFIEKWENSNNLIKCNLFTTEIKLFVFELTSIISNTVDVKFLDLINTNKMSLLFKKEEKTYDMVIVFLILDENDFKLNNELYIKIIKKYSDIVIFGFEVKCEVLKFEVNYINDKRLILYKDRNHLILSDQKEIFKIEIDYNNINFNIFISAFLFIFTYLHSNNNYLSLTGEDIKIDYLFCLELALSISFQNDVDKELDKLIKK